MTEELLNCPNCSGTGAFFRGERGPYSCDDCFGEGKVTQSRIDFLAWYSQINDNGAVVTLCRDDDSAAFCAWQASRGIHWVHPDDREEVNA